MGIQEFEGRTESLPPLVSSNRRYLESGVLGYGEANVEYALPASGELIYVDPVVDSDPKLKSAVMDLARFIVLPTTAHRMPAFQQARLSVLSSQMECGRVLEADKPVVIEGEQFELSAKGGGATEYVRRYMIPMVHGTRRDTPTFETPVAFYGQLGVLGKYSAGAEMRTSQEFGQKGIDAERVLALFELDRLPDEYGVQQPISYFEERGMLRPGLEPTILIRALRSNVRLLDVIALAQSGDYESTEKLVSFIVSDFAKRNGLPGATWQDYFFSLSETLLSQEIALTLEGYQMSEGDLSTHERNISVFGEQIDLESVGISPYAFASLDKYLDNLQDYSMLTKRALLHYMRSLNRVNGGAHIDEDEYAEEAKRTIEAVLRTTPFRDVYNAFDYTAGTSFEEFVEQAKALVLYTPSPPHVSSY